MKRISAILTIGLGTLTSLSLMAATWNTQAPEETSKPNSRYWSTAILKPWTKNEDTHGEFNNNSLNQYWWVTPCVNYHGPSYGLLDYSDSCRLDFNNSGFRNSNFQVPLLLQNQVNCQKTGDAGVAAELGDCVSPPKEAQP